MVPNPTLTAVELELHYPAYMDRPPHTLAVAGAMQIPLATRVVVCGRANKELRSVRIEFPPAERRPAVVQVIEGRALAADRMGFRYALAPVRRDTTLLFTLLDADGIKSREPIPLALVAVADEPPQLAVRLAGIGTAITPAARLPVTGSVSDDYGIARVWYEYAVDQHPPAAAALATLAKHPTEFVLRNAALEARDLKLARGQKLSLAVKAADLCDLGQGPNVGSSESWLLDVVSPEELRAMLEARELVLRQRFEAIVEEMTERRDLLLRMDFSAPVQPAAKPADKAAAKPAAKPAAAKADKAAGAEPGDQPLREENLSPAQRAERRTERVLQALQNCRKNAQETLGVADSIDDIRQQLANNRIDTEELKNRLGAGIAEPLRKICEQMFPELERRLEALQAAAADLRWAPSAATPPAARPTTSCWPCARYSAAWSSWKTSTNWSTASARLSGSSGRSPSKRKSGTSSRSKTYWRNSHGTSTLGAREGDSLIFAGRKSGHSPSCPLGAGRPAGGDCTSGLRPGAGRGLGGDGRRSPVEAGHAADNPP